MERTTKKLTISQIAEQAGVTIEELAKRSDIDPEHLQAVSDDLEEMTACDLIRLCIASGINPQNIETCRQKQSDIFAQGRKFTVKRVKKYGQAIAVTLEAVGYPETEDIFPLKEETLWRLVQFSKSIGLYHDGITPEEIYLGCAGRSGTAVFNTDPVHASVRRYTI